MELSIDDYATLQSMARHHRTLAVSHSASAETLQERGAPRTAAEGRRREHLIVMHTEQGRVHARYADALDLVLECADVASDKVSM